MILEEPENRLCGLFGEMRMEMTERLQVLDELFGSMITCGAVVT